MPKRILQGVVAALITATVLSLLFRVLAPNLVDKPGARNNLVGITVRFCARGVGYLAFRRGNRAS